MTTSVRAILAFVACLTVFAASTQVHAAAVTVREPAFGLPHVCADTDLEAAREQGYQAGVDRMGQLLFVMNVAHGTMHNAIGLLTSSFLDDDIQVRREQYSQDEVATMYATQSPGDQAILLAYSQGVNDALNDMLDNNIEPAFEVRFFSQDAIAGDDDMFGNKLPLTVGGSGDQHYSANFQFTPEIALGFAVLQIRNFGFEGWDEVGMAEDLSKLTTLYGVGSGTELWEDRHWINDPLAPVSVPDSRNPGFGGPLSQLSVDEKADVVATLDRVVNRVRGTARLPGYPMRDYRKAVQPWRDAQAHREENAMKWSAWPKLGSYAWMVAPTRSATGNPWIGGFPQTGIQTPSIMHYTEIRGDSINAQGMTFVGGPYVLIGKTDTVAFTTTTAHLKLIDNFVETLANGDFDLFEYDNHGVQEPMAKRVERVYGPFSNLDLPVFRTNVVCSSNGCTGGDRPVLAFTGDNAGAVDGATGSSITDSDAALTPAALAGGHLAIVDGAGAGQMREIAGNTADTITTVNPFSVTPDDSSEYVAVAAGNDVTAVTSGSSIWMEEGSAANAFARYQKSGSVLDFRSALRAIPSTHNFMASDNLAYNGIGTDHGQGNIYYGTSGNKRVRQGGLDPRLPIDGSGPDPFAIVSGTIGAAGATSLTDVGAFAGEDFSASAINWTYDNPDANGSEYIVVITAGNGYHQSKRVSSNTDDTLSLEDGWGLTPSVGDTYAVYEIWATPEAMNPAEGYSANWNNKQSRANDVMLGTNGRNHRVEMILEQLEADSSIDREDLRALNRYVAGVDPGSGGAPGRYLLTRLAQAIAATSDCGTVDDQLIAQFASAERGRAFENPLVVGPSGEPAATAVRSGAPQYIQDWATELSSDIYGDELDPAVVDTTNEARAIAYVLHAIDGAAGDVAGSYVNSYGGDYFNGSSWEQVVRDSFCDFAVANPTIDDADRLMSSYNHPLAGLPCQTGCETPVEFDPTPYGNRGTWEQIVEVGSTLKGEFMFPMGQSGHLSGFALATSGNSIRQAYHTDSMQPLWRDWRFVPMLDVCQDVTLGGDEDGDTDGDGVLDAFERWYYGDLTNSGSSDTDGDGANLALEYRWGSDPTLADTDSDGTEDGVDVDPQDRLCVSGTLKKLSAKDSAVALKDKVIAKWEVPLNVCVGGDYATACTTDADCGTIGRCRRLRMDPQRDIIRVLAADDRALIDSEITPSPAISALWKNKDGVKFLFKDKDGVAGSPIQKMKVDMNEKKGVLKLLILAKNFDLSEIPDTAEGVVGISINNRCFMETSTNCKTKDGKLSCKAN